MSNITREDILKLYTIRNDMLDELYIAYKNRREYFRNIVLSMNIKRVNMQSLINTTPSANKPLECLLNAYRAKYNAYRETILATNMEMIHVTSIMDKIDLVRQLNKAQYEKDYKMAREYEIVRRLPDLIENDWNEDEKKTMIQHHENISKYDKEYCDCMKQLHNSIQLEYTDDEYFIRCTDHEKKFKTHFNNAIELQNKIPPIILFSK